MAPLPSPQTAPVREGDLLDGKYRVEKVLGVGGMGVVVAATHLQLETRVALKFLLPDVLDNPQIVQRFAREARAAVQIQSEHVARVIDVGTLPTGSPYMVMEYLEGGDLADAVTKGGALPVGKAVGYLLQACEAIAEAHALGIVHRDLKPANLFLARRAGRDSIVKVLDFGISKTSDTGSSALTQTSNVMGSPQYMSPEQMMSSKNVDVRADIWALGVILYELLTGAPPFVAETMAEIVYMVTQRNAPSLLEKRPDLPPALGAVVARALCREPAGRYADVEQLAAALVHFGPARSEISLERIARVLGSRQTPKVEPDASVPPAGPLPSRPATIAPEGGADEVPPRRSRGRLPALAAGGVVLVALVGWRLLRGAPEIRPTPRAEATVVMPTPASAPPPSAPLPPAIITPARPQPPAPVAAAPVPIDVSPSQPEERAAAKKQAAPAHVAHAAQRHSKPHAGTPASSTSAAAPTPEPAAPINRGLNMGMKE